ncbi:integral membrane protein [Streptococcus gordonii]|nr:integral membrane protein [Streptococcus gordonii]
MTNNKLTTRELVELSLFSALIALSIQFFRIPVGPQFIHFGNALVVVATLIYGVRKGALDQLFFVPTFLIVIKF